MQYLEWKSAQTARRVRLLEKGHRIIDMPVKAGAVPTWRAATKTPVTMRAIVRCVLQRHASKA